MADPDLSDYDEYGIYREVPSKESNTDHGIHLDDDGVWRDEADHWSHHTFKTHDSGIAINDHRSSSSTLSRVARETVTEYYGQESYATDSLPPDEKSLNISELEASESMLCDDISFERRSFHSDENLEFPELVDDSYMISSEASRDQHHGRDSLTDHSDYDRYSMGRRGTPDHQQTGYDSDDRQAPDYMRGDLNLDLDLNHDSDWFRTERVENQDKLSEMVQQDLSQPKFNGDSLFTQEEPITVINGHSLVEFEELEARVETFLDGPKMDNLDLIGSYLKGLEQRDTDEISQNSDENSASFLDHLDDGYQSPTNYRTTDAIDQWKPLATSHDQTNSTNRRQRFSVPLKLRKADYFSNDLDDTIDSQSFDDSLPFEEDPENFIENQKPPFDILPTLNTLEISSGFRPGSDFGGSRPGTPHANSRSGERPETPSRIPMLRARSPSMSRPRSRTPTRGQSHSISSAADRIQSTSSSQKLTSKSNQNFVHMSNSRRTDRGRSLPPTPGKTNTEATTVHEDGSTSQISTDLDTFEEGNLPKLSSLGGQMWKSNFEGKLTRHSGLKFVNTDDPNSRSRPMRAMPEVSDLHNSSNDEFYESEPDLSQSSVKTTDLKKRFLKEKEDNKEKQQTLTQLQLEYNNLLKKHATAENLIDELRLGAKINLYSDNPTPGVAQAGTLAPAQHAQTFSIVKTGIASVASVGTLPSVGRVSQPQQPVTGERPGSRASQGSPRKEPGASVTSSAPMFPPGGAKRDGVLDDTNSLAEEGVKLSLFARSKGVEDKVNAFQILLSKGEVSVEDQDKALQHIKASMEQLQQEYRDAKAEYDYTRRLGTGRDSAFDPNKEVEGELYKLGMKIDDIDQVVQDNLKKKSIRVPFQSPVKADHSISTIFTERQEGRLEQDDHELLSPRRPPSVGSIVGASGDIDETLHQLNKDYSNLMDRYRRLKQLKKTPERDKEINTLLRNLKTIYEQTPDHRKPALPSELESLYNPVRGLFMTPDQLRNSRNGLVIMARDDRHIQPRDRHDSKDSQDSRSRGHRRDNRQRSLDSTTLDSSDISSPERGRHNASYTTLENGSSSNLSESPRRRRNGSKQGSELTSTRDAPSRSHPGDSRRHGDSKLRDNKPQTGSNSLNKLGSHTSHRGDRDKDSGYVGSEGSRKRSKESTGVGPSRERSSRTLKTSALKSPSNLYSDSDSGSTASTVEERSTKRGHTTNDDKRTNGKESGRQNKKMSLTDSRGQHSESDEVSKISGNRSSKREDSHQRTAVTGSSKSAFTVNQSQPSILQPRPIQPGQVAAPAVPGVIVPPAPLQHYQYFSPGVSSGVMNPAMIGGQPMNMVNPGIMNMVQGRGAVAMQRPIMPTYAQVQAGQASIQHHQNQMQFVQRPPMVLDHRMPGHVVNEDSYGRGRSQSFGGGRPSDEYYRKPRVNRYRSTQALTGHNDDDVYAREHYDMRHAGEHYDNERLTRERYDLASPAHDRRKSQRGSQSYDRKGSDLREDLDGSGYDYRKRFEQIREERFGKSSHPLKSTKYDSPIYTPDYSGEETDYHATRGRHHGNRLYRDRRFRDRYDNDDEYGYCSDPESPERYTRSRDYYHSQRRRDQGFPAPAYYREAEDSGYDYGHAYDNAPLDEKYLTSSGGIGDIYQPGYVGAQNAGFTGGGMSAAGIDMATRGIQNVPQMSSTGIQYMMDGSVDPNQAMFNMYPDGFGAAGVTACMDSSGMAAVGSYGYQTPQVAMGTASGQTSQPLYVLASPSQGQVNGSISNMSGASYIPVQMIPNSQGVTSSPQGLIYMNGTAPGSVIGGMPVMGGVSPVVGGTAPTVLRLAADRTLNNSKVRYYVREYGPESEVELATRNRRSTSKKVSRFQIEEDSADDLNESLNEVMKTAKRLNKMSTRMKDSLYGELKKTHRKTILT